MPTTPSLSAIRPRSLSAAASVMRSAGMGIGWTSLL
jgi:hypothetical protein